MAEFDLHFVIGLRYLSQSRFVAKPGSLEFISQKNSQSHNLKNLVVDSFEIFEQLCRSS